jgi:hypothetical protein
MKRPLTDAHKRAISTALTGKKRLFTEEHVSNMKRGALNKPPFTAEHKENIRLAQVARRLREKCA